MTTSDPTQNSTTSRDATFSPTQPHGLHIGHRSCLKAGGYLCTDVDQLMPAQDERRAGPVVNARNDQLAAAWAMELANDSTSEGTPIDSGREDICPQDRFTVMPQVGGWPEGRRDHAASIGGDRRPRSSSTPGCARPRRSPKPPGLSTSSKPSSSGPATPRTSAERRAGALRRGTPPGVAPAADAKPWLLPERDGGRAPGRPGGTTPSARH